MRSNSNVANCPNFNRSIKDTSNLNDRCSSSHAHTVMLSGAKHLRLFQEMAKPELFRFAQDDNCRCVAWRSATGIIAAATRHPFAANSKVPADVFRSEEHTSEL